MESENASGSQIVREPHALGLSVLVDPPNPTLDIVFVHGFTGHPQRTWACRRETLSEQHGDEDEDGERPKKFQKLFSSTLPHNNRNGTLRTTYWPRDLIPITAPNARVLTYGYDSRIRHVLGPTISKSTVYDIAWDFLVSLETMRRSGQSRPLLFIAHSLGGIIVKETLRRSRGCELYQGHLRSVFESTSGIFFFGTPHGGADPRGSVHHIAEKLIKAAGFSANEQLVNTLLPASERLRELREEFGPMAHQKKWIIYSFQEQYGVKALNGNKVVDDTASCLNDPAIEVTQHIANNHMEMCRFGGQHDVEYRKVVGALNRILEVAAELALSNIRSGLDLDCRRSYLASLRFEQIDARHATIKKAHAKTCTWFLSKSEYQDWLDSEKILEHHGFLWIKGKPATGKSTMLKFICANAKKSFPETVVISFFFNARGDDMEKSVLGMYRSLLFQLLEKLPELQSVFEILGPTAPNTGEYYMWNVEIVKNLFGHAIGQLGQHHLTCFVDALDECEEDQVRDMVAFFEDLGQFAISSESRFLVCFSSRHYPHITIEKSIQLTLEGQEGHQQDIANYLQSELKAGRSKLIEQIKGQILERASGIFLWVVLVVQMLNKEYDRGRIHALQKRLDEIPNGLDELFQNILVRDGQNMGELILCLQWILYAKRPLKREELYYAILAGVVPAMLTPWSPEQITSQDMDRFLLNASKGLAEVTKSKARTVQFIHESVRDFFLKGNGLNKLGPDLGSNFPGLSHDRLKQCCQNYMIIDIYEHWPKDGPLLVTVPLPSASSDEAASLRRIAFETFPFLEYAVHNVLHHADAADRYEIPQDDFIRRYRPAVSLLYILAEQNLPNLIRIELRRVPHMDIKGERYGFPLLAALARGNENAVRAFLVPHAGSRSDGATLNNHPSYITEQDREEVIRSLLKSVPYPSSLKYPTLFSWAAERGEFALLKVLLASKKADINSATKGGVTPLSFAMSAEREDIVSLLLTTGEICIEAEDYGHRGPQFLVRNDIKINVTGDDSKRVLMWAAKGGHKATVQLLLECTNNDINLRDEHGWIALLTAARAGHEAVVKLLLADENIDVNTRGQFEDTAMVAAAKSGHEAVVKLLLADKNIDVNSRGQLEATALSAAARSGHEAVVKLLLADENIDVNLRGCFGDTAIVAAAGAGHETVVKLLLADENVDVNLKGRFGDTAIVAAAGAGHKAVAKLLLLNKNIDVNSRDQLEATALSAAARSGHEAVVKLLLTDENIDVNLKGRFGDTAIVAAAGAGHKTVVKLLLEDKNLDIKTKVSSGETALLAAAQAGHEAVAKLLLADGNINVNTKDRFGYTALFTAAKAGHEAVVKALLACNDIEINSKDNCGQTALSTARDNGHWPVVELLQKLTPESPPSPPYPPL